MINPRLFFPGFLILGISVLFSFSGCGKKTSQSISAKDTTVVLAILADVDYLNPVISASSISSNVYGTMYPGLLMSEFDTTIGILKHKAYTPSASSSELNETQSALAKSWELSKDHKTLTYILRDDATWNDGKKITSADFKFSYKKYADPTIASARQQYLDGLIKNPDGSTNFEKAILTPDDTTLIFKFRKPVSENLALFHTGLAAIPKHVWQDVSSEEFRSHPLNFEPLGCGPYKLHKWEKQQQISLVPNPNCVLPAPGSLPKIVFRIIPDYTVRVTQLQTNAVDVVQTLKPEDLSALTQKNPNVEIKTVGLRVFDYVGWMTIDQSAYNTSKTLKPHPLFGSKIVRRAMTHAIDRQGIIDGFLGKYGTLATSDISPSFKWATNKDIKPYLYDPKKAVALLESEGWKIGSDGIREKNGKKFSFTLTTNAGNNRRNYASTIIQQNLKEIGIDCKLESQESNVFFKNLRQRKYDAFMAGWSVGLEIDPLDQWGSNLEKSRFNFTGFQEPRIDKLCEMAKDELEPLNTAPYWKEYQQILHEGQPYTFLYWIKETHGFNARIEGEEINILSPFYNMNEWQLATDPKRQLTP